MYAGMDLCDVSVCVSVFIKSISSRSRHCVL